MYTFSALSLSNDPPNGLPQDPGTLALLQALSSVLPAAQKTKLCELFSSAPTSQCILTPTESPSGALHFASLVAEFEAKQVNEGAWTAMPSIAYRLARVSAGDGDAGVSLVPVSAHDVAAGHALLIGAGGVLVDQDGIGITYATEVSMQTVSRRCFGGTPVACQALASQNWSKVFI